MKRFFSPLFSRLSSGAAALAAAGALLCAPQAGALDLGTQPLYLGGSVPPIVMLLTPKDHQLFKKAYDDFSDLDGSLPGGDAALETTYKHTIDYFGYFDSFKCYLYNSANQRFEPTSITADKYCAAGTAWSGNFLNWATMARIDVIRRLLYGGKRSTDTSPTTAPVAAGVTVLERELIPTEAHAWAKHYRGTDIAQLVPFANLTSSDLALTSTTSANVSNQPTISVTSITRVGCVNCTEAATATTAVAHGFYVGPSPSQLQQVVIAGVTGTGSGAYNGTRAITAVPTPTTFTFDVVVNAAGAPPTSPGGTKTVRMAFPDFFVTLPAGQRPFIVGDQVTAAANSTNYIVGEISAVNASSGTIRMTLASPTFVGSGTFSSWTVTNWSRAGISICNATQATAGTSHAPTAPPLLRAAWGDYSLWGVGDGTACRWSDEGGGLNGNRFADSEIKSNSTVPPRAAAITNANLNVSGVTNGDYVVRILACDPALIGSEPCSQYANGNLKPTGLLQDYASGSQKKIRFGLFTGSYTRNKTGGVLRKNPGFLDSPAYNAAVDEIDINSGVFNTSATVPGIIRSFDVLKLFGYTFAAGTGNYSGADGCGLLNPDPTEGVCTSWGNPLSEIYVETLRYLAGKTGPTTTSSFAVTAATNAAATTNSNATVTSTTAVAATGATAVTVGSITLLAGGDLITITLDNGSLHAATVNGAPAGTTVAFLPAIPAGRTVPNAAAIRRATTAGATSVTVAPTAAFANGVLITIVLDNGSIHAATINQTPTPTSIRFTPAIPAGRSIPVSAAIAPATTAGATVVTVISTTSLASGDSITIALDNGSLHAATINAAPTTTTMSFTPAIPAGRSIPVSASIAHITSFGYTDAGSKDFTIGLLQPAWINQITTANYCTPLNIIAMNASVSSYDNDGVPSDLFPSGTTAITLTNTIGGSTYENIVGNFLIGNSGTVNDGVCSPKAVGGTGNSFGNLYGICPEAPALRGSYQMAGAAWWARTNRIRSDITGIPSSDTKSLKVTTYGVALASAVPTITIPVPGASTFVTIQPTARTFNNVPPVVDRGHGSIVDFKVIRQDLALGTGKFFVSWEDSTQGNDYDLDMWGIISYSFPSAGQIQVTTDVIYAAAGHSIAFGYVISGTSTGDGAHFTSAHRGNTDINYHYPTGFNTSTTGNNECNNCIATNAAASKTYTVAAGGAASILKDPLWFAAKYGGFVDQDGNNKPNLEQEWDSKNNITGADGADRNPDTYFPVTNPGALQQALDRAFISVLQVSSASSVATNSTSLQSGSIVYQARFNANEWSGQLLAFSISTAGLIDPVPLWDASQLLPAPTARTIVTFKRNPANQAQGDPGGKGVPFRWASLNSLQQADLNKNPAGTADAAGAECSGVTGTGFTPSPCTQQGSLRLNWLRGDPANEGATASKYRVRPTTKLGDVVNSTPIYVGAPSSLQYGEFSPPAAAYATASEPTFAAWASDPARANRTPMMYAGANDGMLHGFDVSTGSSKGVEKLAYVPATSYRHLTKLTDKSYSHRYFVDGSPTVADVKFQDGTWHTIVTAGLNAGGQGVFALDISNPAAFSEANASSIVLWEFSDHNDAGLGNTYSQPTVAKMNNGRFAVIFTSGYNNSIPETGDTQIGDGCARLYILYVDGGIDGAWTTNTDFEFIDVLTGCSVPNPNGLATPRVVDVDSNGTADYIYAGDLNGHMWKFDVRSSNPTGGGPGAFPVWGLAGGIIPTPTPLFSAVDAGGIAQPITAAATTFPHPTITGTTMVLFGTGKYLEQVDDSPAFGNNTFYGILDRHNNIPFPSINARGELLQQSILGATATGPVNPTGVTQDNLLTTTVDEGGFRITTAWIPNYTGAPRGPNTPTPPATPPVTSWVEDATEFSPPHRGWYLDFPFSGDSGALTPGTGERVAFRPIISTGKLVFTTLIPSTLSCQFGGTGFLMDLDPVTGGRLALFSPFDVNGDSNFTDADKILDPAGNLVFVSGKASSIGIIPTPTVIQMSPSSGGLPGKEVKVLSGSSGQLISVLELAGAPTLPGATGRRILWRQLFTN